MQVELKGYCPVKGRLTARQLDLPSLMPLSVAGCGRLQLETAHWATLLALLQIFDKLTIRSVAVDYLVCGSWPTLPSL